MSGDQDNLKIEAMLRRWGAQEALETVEAGAWPTRQPVRKLPDRRRILRWAPLAAAAAVLAAAVMVAIQPPSKPTAGAVSAIEGANEAIAGELEAVRAQLRQRLHELQDAQAKARDAEKLASDREAAMSALKTGLEERIDGQARSLELLTAELAAAGNELSEACLESSRDRRKLELLQKELDIAAQAVPALEKALEEALKKQEIYRRELAAETSALRKLYDQEAAAARALRGDLAALRAQQALMEADFRQSYLAALAPGQAGAWARQAAARNGRLLSRLAALREQTYHEPTSQALDMLEVLLTRLEMINPDDFVAVAAFGRLVEQSAALHHIDTALASGICAPPLRQWLMEARCVLAGVDLAA